MSSFYVKSIVRKIDLNSTLMESNPAFYQEPEDVRVEVGQVGSGPNQEHLTDQVILIFRIISNQFTFNLTNFLTEKFKIVLFILNLLGHFIFFIGDIH